MLSIMKIIVASATICLGVSYAADGIAAEPEERDCAG